MKIGTQNVISDQLQPGLTLAAPTAIHQGGSGKNATDAYVPTMEYTDEEVEEFYAQLQSTVVSVPNKDVMVVQGDWNAKVGTDSTSRWPGICGQCANAETNEQGHRLLKFADFSDLMLANMYGQHKKSRMWT